MWGRNIYDSIRKFIQFQLTVNVIAVLITLFGAALFKEEILRPIHLLWVNLIMDTLGALALATENPTEALLDRPPHARDDYIISRTMLKHIVGQAVFQFVVLLILVFLTEFFVPEYPDSYDSQPNFQSSFKYTASGYVRSGRATTIDGTPDYSTIYDSNGVHSRHYTFIFSTFIMMQVFNFINCRKIHEEKNVFSGLSNNSLFVIIICIIVFAQILMVTFGGIVFSVYPYWGLHPIQWLIAVIFQILFQISISVVALPISWLLKLCHVEKSVP